MDLVPVAIQGSVISLAVEILKNPAIPVPVQKYPRLFAFLVSALVTVIYSLVWTHLSVKDLVSNLGLVWASSVVIYHGVISGLNISNQ